ncbi:MAG: DUF924 domain-containing protein [Deltaproteobacteria bacterium]|nr:DUF924 domain-containing protein [Deltaproteobacteria bacterium]
MDTPPRPPSDLADLPHAAALDALCHAWFLTTTPELAVPAPRREWFMTDPAFDDALRQAFLPLVHLARDGGLAPWEGHPRGVLGLMLLTDQLPRNLFRASAEAFASDPTARAIARRALDRGVDRDLPFVARPFLYLPFEHAEDPADQDLSVALFEGLERDLRAADPPATALFEWGAQTRDYAHKHRVIIERFGRFPHRNEAIGRPSTPDELAFLASAGRGF